MTVGFNPNLLGTNQVYNNSFNNVNQFGVSQNNSSPNSIFQNQNATFPAFGGNSFNPLNPSFENDMMMPEELKGFGDASMANILQAQESSAPTPVQEVETAQNDEKLTNDDVKQKEEDYNRQELEKKQAELKNLLLAKDKSIEITENGNYYRTTDAAKKTGLVLGFLAPMAGKIIELCKGGNFKELFKFKQLAIACPLIATAGFAVGSMIDGYVNSQRAKNADAITLYK